MPEGKYGKYIVTELFNKFDLPPEREWERAIMGRGSRRQRRRMEHMTWMDSRVVPGALDCEAVWFWPESMRKVITLDSTRKSPGIPHPDVSILFRSCCPTTVRIWNIREELYCQIEFWMEDEKYVFDKSFVVYIPERCEALSFKDV